MLEGGRPIVLFTSPFSGKKRSYILTKYVHTLQFFAILVLVILVELPHLAYISAASVMMLIGNGTCLPTPVSPTFDQTVAFRLLIKIFTS